MIIVFYINMTIICVSMIIIIKSLIGILKSRRAISEMDRRMKLMKEIDWGLRLGLYETVDFKAGDDAQLCNFISMVKAVT